jgi:hypothetical protein
VPGRRGEVDMTRFVHLVSLLAVIAVPLVGWFAEDWSGGTTLAVYWFETVAMCLFILARMVLHRCWTPRRGHFQYVAPSGVRRGSQTSSFVTGFAISSLAFCMAHGVFLGTILFLLDHNGGRALADVSWRSVAFGCLTVFAFLAVGFFADLLSLRRWSFWQIEQTARRGLGRVVVVHLTIVFGLIGVAVTGAPDALFGVFVVLKSLFALGTALPQWEPAAAPGWLSRVMNGIPNVHPGRRFEDLWTEDRADEIERRERNERPWVAARR